MQCKKNEYKASKIKKKKIFIQDICDKVLIPDCIFVKHVYNENKTKSL